MTPDRIDSIIHDEIRTHRTALERIRREQEFAQRKVDELSAFLGCEHEREMVDGMRDRCRHCGFTWVRR